MGPNGQALSTCLVDLYNLPTNLKEALCSLGGRRFEKIIKSLSSTKIRTILGNLFVIKGTSRFRKISHFPDLEGKSRTIAVLDY